jgi:hypothetical protein
MGMLREVADLTGLAAEVTDALADTHGGRWTHAPGAFFADLAQQRAVIVTALASTRALRAG